ncbi:hypothetical protein PI124_g16211 [Phytophthora idaei]|uniref:Uncharacterized protein n=1 Tax=Phytophthora aleatoria TaxID=2496075 RepID=A0A8J5ILN1_9STRA|nr:hypothetical protein PI125_g16529 [Phytophthora idaei]KAG3141643.1 hypothetical protein PI126_g15419 [Phytophthora idaei]KAG3238852.1 hypothetical protein PI124_g16211 [Phytophthora idaei]KAG6965430.1 hypothetical protein JG688_00007215 [Phytophthora aleatoria]
MPRRGGRVSKSELPNGKPPADESEDGDVAEFMSQEAAYRKEFDPVAPWKRDDIPDYGPLQDRQHVLIFGVVGVVCTVLYEATDYFNEIHRWLAYMAIWFPLWFRLLGRVSPALTDEELDSRERRDFEQELQRIVDEKDEVDD